MLREQEFLLSQRDLAERLQVSKRKIQRMDVAGQLPRPIRLGRSVRWRASEIDEWLQGGAPSRRLWEQREAQARGQREADRG